MKRIISILSGLATVNSIGLKQSALFPNSTTDQAIVNTTYAPLSQSQAALIVFNLFEGLGFMEQNNATACITATKQAIDQGYFFT